MGIFKKIALFSLESMVKGKMWPGANDTRLESKTLEEVWWLETTEMIYLKDYIGNRQKEKCKMIY